VERTMGARDQRIDAYISKSADFARPVLKHLREVVHTACPDVEETIKWQMPAFDYKGIMCGMAAFKEHCTFGFWKHELLIGDRNGDAMGSFGRITSLNDLPSDRTLTSLIKKAAKLNADGVKTPRKKPAPKPPLAVPTFLTTALKKNAAARKSFDALSPSHKREYIEWLTEAKTDATRDKRLGTALAWIAEGKSRNWKYMA
jgi:uncharacterized protein YdeI (YjbR/CyaY-like superfamily)